VARKLIVEIVGDPSALQKSYAAAEKSTKRFGQSIENAGRGATVATVGFRGLGRTVAFTSGAFLGGAGLAAGMKASIDAASNLNEEISKTNVVFGRSAEEVKAWSETSARSLGLAQDQALAVASSFGALFKPLGLVGPEAARQSEQLTQLGADLASFYNTDVQQALDAIRSGLVGESEPLRQYGILLSETRVQEEALKETHKRTAAELTDLDKVQARINLTMKDAKPAVGDLARTQGSFANQTRQLAANLRDLGASTAGRGAVFLLGNTFKGWNLILGKINEVGDAQQKLTLAPEELRVVVPRLAGEYERLRAAGVGVAEAHKLIVAEFADEKHGVELLGAALDYIVNPEMRAKVAKLQHSFEGVGLAVEDAAKGVSGIGLAAAAREAARPRGEAAIGPGQRLGLAAARADITPGSADNLKVLVEQRELFAKQIQSLQNRLSGATGKKARDLVDQLRTVLQDDAAALSEITSIQQANAQTAADAAAKIKAASAKHAEAVKAAQEAMFDRLQFNVDKTGLTDTLQDDLKALRKYQTIIKQIIATQGSTLELQKQLLAVELNIKGVQGQITDNRKAAAEAAKAAAAAAKQQAAAAAEDAKAAAVAAAAAKTQAAIDRSTAIRDTLVSTDLAILGDGGAGPDSLATLVQKLAQAKAAIKGTSLATAEIVHQLDAVTAVLFNKLGVPLEEVGGKISEILDGILDKTKKLGQATPFKHISGQKFVEGLGLNLTPEQKKRLEVGFATVGAGGTVPGARSTQFTGAGAKPGQFLAQSRAIHIENFHSSAPDMPRIENEIVRRTKARPHTRRGN
jgi:hypothetical protein